PSIRASSAHPWSGRRSRARAAGRSDAQTRAPSMCWATAGSNRVSLAFSFVRGRGSCQNAAANSPTPTLAAQFPLPLSILVLVVPAYPGHRVGQALLVAALGYQVEQVIGAVQHVQPARIAGVGVEYLAVRAFDEHADPRRLRRPEPAGLVVVDRRLLLLGREGDVVVAVEVVAIGRHPLEAPAHTFPVALQFLKRRARDRHQRHVAVAQMHHGAVVVVRPERAALATFLPVRPEHEVIYEELVSPVEQVGQRFLAGGP